MLTGSFERWQSILEKELDVVKAMMQGKIKLKGSLPKIVRYVKACIRLVDLTSRIGTRFQTEMSEEELASFKNWFNQLRLDYGF